LRIGLLPSLPPQSLHVRLRNLTIVARLDPLKIPPWVPFNHIDPGRSTWKFFVSIQGVPPPPPPPPPPGFRPANPTWVCPGGCGAIALPGFFVLWFKLNAYRPFSLCTLIADFVFGKPACLCSSSRTLWKWTITSSPFTQTPSPFLNLTSNNILSKPRCLSFN